MIVQSADAMLFGWGRVRRLLHSLDQDDVPFIALAPPSLAMLDAPPRGGQGASCRPMIAPPAWYLDFLPHSSHTGGHIWAQKDNNQPYFAPLEWAASSNRERLGASGPLTMLAFRQDQVVQAHRFRRIDRITNGLARCSLLIVGSGEMGLPILAGAQSLIARCRPLVVFDLAELLIDRSPDHAYLVSAVMERLPDYRMAYCPPVQGGAINDGGRFLIAHADATQADRLYALAGNQDMGRATEWSTDRLCPIGIVPANDDARFVAAGPGTAIEFAIECPQATTTIAFELEGHAPHGLRILIDGTDHGVANDAQAGSRQATDARPFRVSAQLLNPPRLGPRLLRVRLCPIRMSTTGGNAPLKLKRVIAVGD